MPYDNRDPKRDHNFDNHPSRYGSNQFLSSILAKPTALTGMVCSDSAHYDHSHVHAWSECYYKPHVSYKDSCYMMFVIVLIFRTAGFLC